LSPIKLLQDNLYPRETMEPSKKFEDVTWTD